MPSKTKPKFKKGQVVYWKGDKIDKPFEYHTGGVFAKITKTIHIDKPAHGKPRWIYGVVGFAVNEFMLRKLTKREKGE